MAELKSRIVVAIPWWRDGDLLAGALDSVTAAGLEAVCLDGAYRTYHPTGPWTTPQEEWPARRPGVLMVGGAISAPFEHEAEKRTALLRLAEDFGAEWVLFLDADERLEAYWKERRPSDEVSQMEWLPAWWAMVQISQPPIPGFWYVPRLIRLDGALEFRPPRDFDLYRDGERIAYLDGEPVPEALKLRGTSIPPAVLRIRHDRHLRTEERQRMSAEYVIRRREEHGVA